MKKTHTNQLWQKKIVLVIALLIGIFTILPLISSIPYIRIIYPENITYNINVLNLNYTSDGEFCWYSLDLGETNSSYYECGINWTDLVSNEGSNTWIVYANDSLGDENSSSVTFFKETIYPIINITYPLNQFYNFNITELNYTSDGINCWYSLNLGETNSSSVSCGINFTDLISIEGTNTWTIYANNSLGNEAFDSVIFIIDTINPSIRIIYPENILYYGLISILNYLTDGITSNYCWYSLNNGITNYSAMLRGRGGGEDPGGPGEGELICNTELSNLVSNIGSNTWTVWINDTAGNVNSSSVTFVISSWSSETGQTIYDLMDSAGAGLGKFMINFSQGAFVFLVLIGLIIAFIIIGYAVAKTIIESVKNSRQ